MLNLIKLVVGVASLEELAARQTLPQNLHAPAGATVALPVVHTRAFPRQAEALLEGGSLYRVIGGLILCRQTLEAIETHTRADGSTGTLLFLSPTIIRVQARPMRPFQGWRYLAQADAPPDSTTTAADLPETLLRGLSELGL